MYAGIDELQIDIKLLYEDKAELDKLTNPILNNSTLTLHDTLLRQCDSRICQKTETMLLEKNGVEMIMRIVPPIPGKRTL